ncbi:MAG: GTPase HflX [Bauldia sp.]
MSLRKPNAGSDRADVTKGERTIVVVPYLRDTPAGDAGKERPEPRSTEGKLDEAVGLARAIDLEVVAALSVPMSAYRPSTLLGSGKVEEIAAQVEAGNIGLAVIDHPLTPVQQRNLEKAWKTKVIDRTGLILEIFGERAQTREGRLQVELAHLNYQKSRLVRSWTHLERQRGGFGFLGGPGETQIEADRRMIGERILKIKDELKGVARTRRLQRAHRRRLNHPVVALVGYTNAGKSTLFNALTSAGVRAEDLLFATLDPRLRRAKLPHGGEILVSDTVGFVSDLPTHLVAAFKATLEEVVEADLILHVRDIAHPETQIQTADVADVLQQLGVDPNDPERVIEVWNKIDLLPTPPPAPRAKGQTVVSTIGISALTGEGVPALLRLIEDRVTAEDTVYEVRLADSQLADLYHAYELGEVLSRDDGEDGVALKVRVPLRKAEAFHQRFPFAVEAGASVAPKGRRRAP